MAELYWGGKKVLGIKPPGEDYIELRPQKVLKGFSYSIPEGTTSLAEEAFKNWHSLSSVTIPASVISIGSNCFLWCDLDSIYFEGDPPETFGSNWWTHSSTGKIPTIYYKADNHNWDALTGSDKLGGATVKWATY